MLVPVVEASGINQHLKSGGEPLHIGRLQVKSIGAGKRMLLGGAVTIDGLDVARDIGA